MAPHTISIASVASVMAMKISRPVLVNSSLAVLMLAALVGGYCVIANPFAASASSSASLLTGTVLAGTVSSSVTASGSIAAVNTVAASFAVSGVIATVNTTLGATVAAGDVLGTLDTTDLSKALTKTKTSLANARSSLSDANTSAAADTSGSGGSSSQTNSARQQVISAQSSVTDAINAVATAQSNLDSSTLFAPIAGLVVAVDGSVGASTSGGSSGSASSATTKAGSSTSSSTSTSFATIANVAQMTMTANIAEADIASVSVGQAASVTFPALSGVTAAAKVSAVSPVATASNSVVTYATTISLDAIPAGLRLGQTAEVSIITASSMADALYVPTAAVTTANGTSTVKVVASGKTSTKTVTLGIIGDTGTEIKSGLTAGQIVVIGTVAANGTGTNGTGTNGTGTNGTGTIGLGGGGGARFGGGTPPTGGNR